MHDNYLRRITWLTLTVASVTGLVGCHAAGSGQTTTGGATSSSTGGSGGTGSTGGSNSSAGGVGQRWHVGLYQAENASFLGGAQVVGAADASDRTRGDLAGEASGRQAVTLTQTDDGVSFAVQAAEAGASAVVVRFSIPDASAGGGADGTLALAVQRSGAIVESHALNVTSRYTWAYGGLLDGTKLYNVAANANSPGSTHLYDEIQLNLSAPLQPNDVITLTKTADSQAATVAIDFVELEVIPAPLTQPSNYLSLTSAACGGVPFDVHQTGQVFDGQDDSSYASNFNALVGINPYNPVSFQVHEKDYYSNALTDALQDQNANAAAGGLSMFQLADNNRAALASCLSQAVAAGSAYQGVFIPPGRFYMRGTVALPNNANILGAGMWYTKLTAVDTSPPVTVQNNGTAGIAGVSGNFMFVNQTGGASNVTVSNFAMFGNVTQRDTVDYMPSSPMGVHGQFTNSTFDNLWVEHYFIGLNFDSNSEFTANSNLVTISNSRARNEFADGIDFYGATSNSTITHSHARSNGDDGFALWAQGTTPASVAQSNTVTRCVSELSWWGCGFSIYGGNGTALTRSNAYDVLNYPCVQASTQFVPDALPTSASMSAAVSEMNFYRCGGNGYQGQYGALLIGTNTESINGINVSSVNIYSPSYKGIDVRTLGATSTQATLSNVLLSNVNVVNAPACAGARSNYLSGSVQLNDVCYCAGATGTSVTCPSTNSNASTNTFAFMAGIACDPTSCENLAAIAVQ